MICLFNNSHQAKPQMTIPYMTGILTIDKTEGGEGGGPWRPLKMKTFIVIRLFPLLHRRHKRILYLTHNWSDWPGRVSGDLEQRAEWFWNWTASRRVPGSDVLVGDVTWTIYCFQALKSNWEVPPTTFLLAPSLLFSSPTNRGHLPLNEQRLAAKLAAAASQSDPPKCSFQFLVKLIKSDTTLLFFLIVKTKTGDQWTVVHWAGQDPVRTVQREDKLGLTRSDDVLLTEEPQLRKTSFQSVRFHFLLNFPKAKRKNNLEMEKKTPKQIPLKLFNASMSWFLRRIDTEVYRKSITETVSFLYISPDVRGPRHMTFQHSDWTKKEMRHF